MAKAAELEIIWRNPKPTQRKQRWEQIETASGAAHYQIKELISTFTAGSVWIPMSVLEVIPGGRAA